MSDEWINKIHEGKIERRTLAESQVPFQDSFVEISERFWIEIDCELRRVVQIYNSAAEPEGQLELSEVNPALQIFGVSSAGGPLLNVEFHKDELKITARLAVRQGLETHYTTRHYGVRFDGKNLHAEDHTIESLAQVILTPFLEATP
jgi:hypothetical protein